MTETAVAEASVATPATQEVVDSDARLLAQYETNETCRYSIHPHDNRCSRLAVFAVTGWDVVCTKELRAPSCEGHLVGFLESFEGGHWCVCTSCRFHLSINIRAHRLA